ncbi:hypothetical protein B9Z55_028604 [Caenorhabditis nigoni]|nr:hypothetical protein B9Z55_028604 [Caenorhabditis nigoni]
MCNIALILWIVTALVVFIFVLSILSCFLLACILATKQLRRNRVRARTAMEDSGSVNRDFCSCYNRMGRVDVYLENEEEEAGKRSENQEDSKKEMADEQEMAPKKKDAVQRRPRPYVRIPKEKVKQLLELAVIVKKVYPKNVRITINDNDIFNMSQNISIENVNLYGPSNDRTVRKLRRLVEAIKKAGLDQEEEDNINEPCTSQSLGETDTDRLDVEKQEKLKKIVLDAGFKKDHFQINTNYRTYLALKHPLRHTILRNRYYIL